jgi:putative PIN family toxin of toxin-antitoxin system
VIRALFDTNVFLSAIVFGGNPERVFLLARERRIQLLVSPAILMEMAFILKEKFGWSDRAAADAVRTIGRAAELIKPSTTVSVLKDDGDNRILECAVEGHADVIVSGDHHLLDLKEYQGLAILRPTEFLDQYERLP